MLETCIVTGIRPDARTPRQVRADFDALVGAGARLRVAGRGRARPRDLLARGYAPRYRIRLFDTHFYLAEMREEPNARFFVTWVLPGAERDLPARRRALWARYFYKDASLVWRSASHFARSEHENWIGKGDMKPVLENGKKVYYSAEETTNLPLEIQAALDELSRRPKRVRRDDDAIDFVLRRAPDDRVEPYADFTAPRRRAAAKRANRIHGGEPVAWFARKDDPASLRFARGFEPDFDGGTLEDYTISSRLYGGLLRKYRILSRNRTIQYQFVLAPRQAWIVPPQALTTELSSFGVRTIDVNVDDDLCVPGYEYHYLDDSEDPPRMYSQIPNGFAGGISEVDPARADAAPWLEALPVIQAFRKSIGAPRPR